MSTVIQTPKIVRGVSSVTSLEIGRKNVLLIGEYHSNEKYERCGSDKTKEMGILSFIKKVTRNRPDFVLLMEGDPNYPLNDLLYTYKYHSWNMDEIIREYVDTGKLVYIDIRPGFIPEYLYALRETSEIPLLQFFQTFIAPAFGAYESLQNLDYNNLPKTEEEHLRRYLNHIRQLIDILDHSIPPGIPDEMWNRTLAEYYASGGYFTTQSGDHLLTLAFNLWMKIVDFVVLYRVYTLPQTYFIILIGDAHAENISNMFGPTNIKSQGRLIKKNCVDISRMTFFRN